MIEPHQTLFFAMRLSDVAPRKYFYDSWSGVMWRILRLFVLQANGPILSGCPDRASPVRYH